MAVALHPPSPWVWDWTTFEQRKLTQLQWMCHWCAIFQHTTLDSCNTVAAWLSLIWYKIYDMIWDMIYMIWDMRYMRYDMRYDMRCDMIWDVIWCEMWYDVRCDMMWDVIWCDMCDMLWYDVIWCDMMWYVWYMIYDMIRCDMIYMIWYMIWYDMFNCHWVDTQWQ